MHVAAATTISAIKAPIQENSTASMMILIIARPQLTPRPQLSRKLTRVKDLGTTLAFFCIALLSCNKARLRWPKEKPRSDEGVGPGWRPPVVRTRMNAMRRAAWRRYQDQGRYCR